jgi:hypothetical protein
MKTAMAAVLTAISCAVALEAHAAIKVGELSCQTSRIINVDFPAGDLPFANGTIVTSQFKSAGLSFSSTNPQSNVVQDGSFYNPDRINFVTRDTVLRVSIALTDDNSALQTHTLSAYDKNDELLDTATFTDPSWSTYPQLCGIAGGCQFPTPDRFTLTVSSCRGIAYVTVDAQAPGAQALEGIVYSLK